MTASTMPIHRFREEHMTTTFEIQIAHESETYAQQAAQAAFQTTARLEKLLSRYRDDSEVSQLRHLTEGGTLRLSVDTFSCLQLASEMQRMTGGAFDPGLGAEVDRARGKTLPGGEAAPSSRGQLALDSENFTARCLCAPVNLDLGAIGKGFTVDRMAEDLREWDITRALILASGSSILAMDGPGVGPDSTWEITIAGWHRILLRNGSIGCSGTAVKGAHILDPRSGQAAQGSCRTWAFASSAAVSDALCTAWMLLGAGEIQEVCREAGGARAIVQQEEEKPNQLTQITPEGIFIVQDNSQIYAG
jgi:FAD:protein FMN transferase